MKKLADFCLKSFYVILVALMFLPVAQAQDNQNVGEPRRESKKPNPQKNVYFGEQHLHTVNSPDAFGPRRSGRGTDRAAGALFRPAAVPALTGKTRGASLRWRALIHTREAIVRLTGESHHASWTRSNSGPVSLQRMRPFGASTED